MPSANCGYHGAPSADALLVRLGPALKVHIGFDASYKPSDNRVPVPAISDIEALVDTGAEESCIDSLLAAQLALPVVDRRTVAGVNGTLEVSMHLAQIQVSSLKFVIHGSFAGVQLAAGGFRYSVLLGRTFLRYFQTEYDGPRGFVVISSDD